MKQDRTTTPAAIDDEEAQMGEGKSINKQEQLKRLVKQHPQRESARVDGENEEGGE